LNPQGDIIAHSNTTVTLQPGQFSSIIESTLQIPTNAPDGEYRAQLRTSLINDGNPTNDARNITIFVGNLPQFDKYQVQYGNSILRGTTGPVGDYTVEVLGISTQQSARVVVRKGSYQSSATIIKQDELYFFDGNRFALIYRAQFGDEAAFDYGVPTTAINVTPNRLIVDAGSVAYFDVTSSVGKASLDSGFGADASVVFPWLREENNSGSNFRIRVSPPLNVQRGIYEFWPIINGGYVQLLEIQVREPINARAISMVSTTGTNQIIAGQTETFTATFSNPGGYNIQDMSVKFEVTGPNDFVLTRFSTVSIARNEQVSVDFEWITMGAAIGSYSVSVDAVLPGDPYPDNKITASYSIVKPPAPLAVQLLNPVSELTGIMAPVDFSWIPDQNAILYELEIAFDAEFTLKWHTRSISDTTYTLTELPSESDLFWRVRGLSSFSDPGTWSEVRQFKTARTIPKLISVQFILNTATIPDTVRQGDLIQLRGSVNGQVGEFYGKTINWESNSVELSNIGGDYWSTHLTLQTGDRLEYKFFTGKNEPEGLMEHIGGGLEIDNPDPESQHYILEIPEDADGDIILPVLYFNRVAPFESKLDSIALFFRVNVGYQVQSGEFNVDTDVVGVRGGNPILDWGTTKLLLEPEVIPTGSQNVFYSGAYWVPESMAGEQFKFKYVHAGQQSINTGSVTWDIAADASNPDVDGNNVVIVGQADTTYAFKFFEGMRPSQLVTEPEPTTPQIASVVPEDTIKARAGQSVTFTISLQNASEDGLSVNVADEVNKISMATSLSDTNGLIEHIVSIPAETAKGTYEITFSLTGQSQSFTRLIEVLDSEVISTHTRGWTHLNTDKISSNYYPIQSKSGFGADFSLGWEILMPYQFDSSYLLSGDVTGDGNLEVVTVQRDTLYVIGKSGSVITRQFVGIIGMLEGRATLLADFSSNGALEIAVGYRRNTNGPWYSRLYHGDGTLYKEVRRNVSQDGFMEIIANIEGHALVRHQGIWSGNPRGFSLWDLSEDVMLWEYNVGPYSTIPSIADVNDNGLYEISYGTWTPHNGVSANGTNDSNTYTVIVDQQGNPVLVQQFPGTTSERKGGLSEIFVRLTENANHQILSIKDHNRWYPGTSLLYIRDLDGTVKHSFNGQYNSYWFHSVADLYRTGTKQIVVTNSSDDLNKIFVLNDKLELLHEAELPKDFVLSAVSDLTSNGTEEILLISRSQHAFMVLNPELEVIYEYVNPAAPAVLRAIVSDVVQENVANIVLLTTAGVHLYETVIKENDTSLFAMNLRVADQSDNNRTLKVGIHNSATSGFDTGLDQFAPPPPPDGAFDARVIRGDDSYFTDFQPPNTSITEWQVRFRPASGAAPITLSWNPEELPVQGVFRLRDNINGTFIDKDMRIHDQVTVSDAFITEIIISYSKYHSLKLPMASGWNLVGLPLDKAHESYTTIFTGALDQTLFGFSQSYQQQAVLSVGKGYWMRYLNQKEETLIGSQMASVDIELTSGWNLISGPSLVISAGDISDPSGVVVPGTLFGFRGFYIESDELEPGRGYWIRASAAGSISIGGNQAVAREVTGAPLADLGSFDRFEIVRGGSATGEDLNHSQEEVLSRLYFGGELPEDLHELAYTMPPAAPGQSLDARFADDRWVSGSLVAEVVLSGTTDVLWMRVMPAGYEGESGDGVDAAAASTTSSSNKGVYLLTAWSGEIVTDTQQVMAVLWCSCQRAPTVWL
jgi:hypothetical protein